MRTLMVLSLIVNPAAAQEDGWKTEIDDNLARVPRRHVAPHASVSTLVFLSDYSVRITGPGRHEELNGKPGEILWHPGGAAGFENLSGRRLDVVQGAGAVLAGTETGARRPTR